MKDEVFKYFVSYIINDKEFCNNEFVYHKWIESMEDIYAIELQFKKNVSDKVTVLNYRVF